MKRLLLAVLFGTLVYTIALASAAMAMEQAGDQEAAIAAYRAAGNEARGTPYAVSAVYRLRLNEISG